VLREPSISPTLAMPLVVVLETPAVSPPARSGSQTFWVARTAKSSKQASARPGREAIGALKAALDTNSIGKPGVKLPKYRGPRQLLLVI
jgi:hypothetical protein